MPKTKETRDDRRIMHFAIGGFRLGEQQRLVAALDEHRTAPASKQAALATATSSPPRASADIAVKPLRGWPA